MILIGLCGAKRSGKNTFARLVIQELEKNGVKSKEASWASILKVSAAKSLGYEFETADEYEQWADTFKEECSITIEIIDIMEEPEMKKVKSVSGRKFLQLYGTEAHRETFGDNFWIEAFWADNDFSKYDVAFITDCRFENEALSVLQKKGKIIKIENMSAEENNQKDNHDSENGIPKNLITQVIKNNSSLEDFEQTAKIFAKDIIGDIKNG
jgi:hypothetical protein